MELCGGYGKAQCDRVFKNNCVPSSKVVEIIKSQVFTWVKYRRPKCSYKWVEWANYHFSCL